MADGEALSCFQPHFEHSVSPLPAPLQMATSFGVELFFAVFFFMLELTSCLALCEMYWPKSCSREDRGLLVISVCFVVSILENKAWGDLLILPSLPNHWRYSIYVKAVSLPRTDAAWIKEFYSQISWDTSRKKRHWGQMRFENTDSLPPTPSPQ